MDKHTRIVFNQKHIALIYSSLSRTTLYYVQINKLSTDLGIKTAIKSCTCLDYKKFAINCFYALN